MYVRHSLSILRSNCGLLTYSVLWVNFGKVIKGQGVSNDMGLCEFSLTFNAIFLQYYS